MKKCPETGKTCYLTKKEAIKAMKAIEAIQDYYYCPDCSEYHLTKTKDEGFEAPPAMNQIFIKEIRKRNNTFIKELSNRQTLHRINLEGNWFLVIYNKKNKQCRYKVSL